MSTLAEFMIVAGADNHPPMLDKPQYESWKSHMELYFQDKDHGRIILNSVENGPLVCPTVELENDTVRPKTYEELSDKQMLQADCDHKATNIVLQGLPPDGYALINHHKISKDIWDRVKLLMQGTSLSRQKRECKLYDEFDKLSHVKGLKVPTFLPGDDPIACMNKAMAFLLAVFPPRYPSINNQLRSFSNLRNQATVQDGRVKQRMSSTQPKRSRDATWFREKVLLVQAQAEGKELDEEQLAFLTDPGVADGQVAQTITHNAAFQTEDLDAYDFDCNDISSAKVVLMAYLSSCDSDVLFEVPYSDTSQNDMMNQKETQQANNESKIVNESLTTEPERYKERVKILEQRFNVDLYGRENFIESQMDDMIQMKITKFAAFEMEIDTLCGKLEGGLNSLPLFKLMLWLFIKI
ncbi:hypothetical protein Tco_0613021 [Tanacetum coccineum]